MENPRFAAGGMPLKLVTSRTSRGSRWPEGHGQSWAANSPVSYGEGSHQPPRRFWFTWLMWWCKVHVMLRITMWLNHLPKIMWILRWFTYCLLSPGLKSCNPRFLYSQKTTAHCKNHSSSTFLSCSPSWNAIHFSPRGASSCCSLDPQPGSAGCRKAKDRCVTT